MPSLTSRPAVGDGQVLVTAARAGHPGGPPAGCPGDRRVLPESPGARIEAARPPGGGGDPLSIPGRRPTPTSSRTGGTGSTWLAART